MAFLEQQSGVGGALGRSVHYTNRREFFFLAPR